MSRVPSISVIVPCYNGLDFLVHSMRSVLSQDEGDLELLFVDDASTDGSVVAAHRVARGDSRVRVLSAEHNRGMTANWNAGLAAARGEFVCKLDCDDAWRPGTLRALVGAFESNPSITAALCRTTQCDAELQPVGPYLGDLAFVRRGVDPSVDSTRPGTDWYEWCFDDIQIWHSNAFMLRRSTLVDRLGGWDGRFGCASDTDLILRILELGGDVAHLGHQGVWYRATPGSVSAIGRRQGWVSVESQLACALSLQRTASRRSLSRHLRIQRRRYRAGLHGLIQRGAYQAPERVASGHRELLEDLEAMSFAARMTWSGRCWLSDLMKGGRRNAMD